MKKSKNIEHNFKRPSPNMDKIFYLSNSNSNLLSIRAMGAHLACDPCHTWLCSSPYVGTFGSLRRQDSDFWVAGKTGGALLGGNFYHTMGTQPRESNGISRSDSDRFIRLNPPVYREISSCRLKGIEMKKRI